MWRETKIGPTDNPGEKTIPSLTAGRCPGLRLFIVTRLRHLSDWSLCASLKIGANGIPKALIGRRGVFRLRRLGFVRSARYLESLLARFVPRRRRRSIIPPSQLDLPIPPASLFVSGALSAAKSSMPSGLPEKEDSRDPVTVGTPMSPVGDL